MKNLHTRTRLFKVNYLVGFDVAITSFVYVFRLSFRLSHTFLRSASHFNWIRMRAACPCDCVCICKLVLVFIKRWFIRNFAHTLMRTFQTKTKWISLLFSFEANHVTHFFVCETERERSTVITVVDSSAHRLPTMAFVVKLARTTGDSFVIN